MSKPSISIPLREWADGALKSIDVSAMANESFTSSFGADPSSWPADVRRSMALSSDAYLKSALEVASSLANQLRRAGRDGENGTGGEERPTTGPAACPPPGPGWSDRIAVHLSDDDAIVAREGDSLRPLPFSREGPRSDPGELLDVLNCLKPDEHPFDGEDDAAHGAPGGELMDVLDSLNPGESFFDAEDDVLEFDENDEFFDGEPTGDSGLGEDGVPFHKVARAEILPRTNEDGEDIVVDERQRLYSLGIVFYELFSGGERHPDSAKESGGVGGEAGEPVPNRDRAREPIARGDGRAFDLAGELTLGDAGDDDRRRDEFRAPDKKKGPRTARRVSVEPLDLRGLPARLCDLIGNMIDCADGDLGGEEAYRDVSDVCGDLRLMLDEPGRFLRDMDWEKLAATGLRLDEDEAFFGRERDFSTLRDSYRRSISGNNECAIISGPSGVGKSVLARRLGSLVVSGGGLFLSGKFDRLPQAEPFSALAAAFNGYCEKMSGGGRSSHLQAVASKLRIALGSEALHLVRAIPNLSVILGERAGDPEEDQDCVNAQKRLQYLLCQFVGAISSSSGVPVTLFLDDLQWADPASISAIEQILLHSGSSHDNEQFFFLGCSREDELLGHPIGDMLTSIRRFGVHATELKLACMDKGMTNTMVSDLLCLSPRLTRTLSEIIFHKTKGNPLFFSQLMMSLCKDGLVRVSLSRRRWEWDEEKIRSRKMPDDVAAFLTSSIEKLPQGVQTALSTLSCFGHATNTTLIETLETKLGNSLIVPLEFAVSEGVLGKINGQYSFGHDRLQEAAYNMIPSEDRCLLHFKYGVALVPGPLELQDDSLLFTAASQINRGGPAAVGDAKQATLIANLNLTAGRKAAEMSDFPAAYSFFDNGISFLRKNHWQEHYSLSLQLFEAASKCALVLGDMTGLDLLSGQILKFSDSFEEKMNTQYNIVCALAYASQLPKSVESSISILSQLGEELPDSYTELNTKAYIQQTHAMLKGFTTNQELIEYKRMRDPDKIMAMKFYAKVRFGYAMIKVEAQPIVTMKMVQLSIAHGMSPMAPIGFTFFGQILARLGDISEGCRYASIGRKLLERLGSKEVAGEVIATGTQTMCFVEPVQATLETHVQGHTTAMIAGDTHGALFNSLLQVITSFWAGTKLSVWGKQYAQAYRLMKEHTHMTFLAHMVQWEKNVSILTGTNDFHDPENPALRDVRGVNRHASQTLIFQKMYIKFMFREYEEMRALAEKYFDYSDFQTWTLLYAHTAHALYRGLVSFWVYRQSSDPKWAGRAQEAKFLMKKWAKNNQWNFQSKLYLMEAEEAFCHNDFDHAESLYEKALASARDHRFLNEEALIHELAGHFFLKMDNKHQAVVHFMQAHEKYHEWGAVAKSNSLFEFVRQVIGCGSGGCHLAELPSSTGGD